MRHALWSGLFALMILSAGTARADVPSPDGKYHPKPWGHGAPPPGWFEQNRPQPAPPQPPTDPATGKPIGEVKEEKKPQRSGPFRSCGSGMGTGLAGIGATWAVLWLGLRFVRAKRVPEARG